MRIYVHFLSLLLGLMVAGPASAQTPQKIVSLNLCADQYLLSLAPVEKITALSRYARDKDLSFYHKRAREFVVTRSTIEEIVALKPDLVIAGTYTAPAMRGFLRKLKISLMVLPHPENFVDVKRQIRRVAKMFGTERRGENMVIELDQALAALKLAGVRHRDKTVLYLQRRGLVTGSETLIDALISHAGLKNAARQFGIKGFDKISLEEIVAAKPEVLILGRDIKTARDQGSALLQHVALRKTIPEASKILLPVRQTVCPGPALIEAVGTLARALEALP